MGTISKSYRYGIGIIGTDPFSLGDSGGGVNLEKVKNTSFF